ncbi:hypothetical protein P175DRAFT_0534732 [Aspergillus ochraceoroseus IBT 24754]|uniref:Uncharacterized protein n=1 Tax=Aspergillus ochraceoroseus IBT 24754 TaxID=1392256 RepID=A0A2T5LRN8_9EURO|nr:uncharacterized protein P175DRAFT_0534732 [Aspergillus ochraceoroseus IBT 24754]PTU18952.1 hypothetical protein P175DRAFT_0534732 [Aspergillus ochraceoroseus IBT 24754]
MQSEDKTSTWEIRQNHFYLLPLTANHTWIPALSLVGSPRSTLEEPQTIHVSSTATSHLTVLARERSHSSVDLALDQVPTTDSIRPFGYCIEMLACLVLQIDFRKPPRRDGARPSVIQKDVLDWSQICKVSKALRATLNVLGLQPRGWNLEQQSGESE